MNKELSIMKMIIFDATISKVWDVLINPKIISEYLFGTEVISDWQVGSEMIFQGVWEEKEYKDKGNILSIESEKLLRYNYWSGFSGLEDKEENYSIVTYQLEEKEDGTLLTLTQEGFANEQAREHSEISWSLVLDKMKEILESE